MPLQLLRQPLRQPTRRQIWGRTGLVFSLFLGAHVIMHLSAKMAIQELPSHAHALWTGLAGAKRDLVVAGLLYWLLAAIASAASLYLRAVPRALCLSTLALGSLWLAVLHPASRCIAMIEHPDSLEFVSRFPFPNQALSLDEHVRCAASSNADLCILRLQADREITIDFIPVWRTDAAGRRGLTAVINAIQMYEFEDSMGDALLWLESGDTNRSSP